MMEVNSSTNATLNFGNLSETNPTTDNWSCCNDTDKEKTWIIPWHNIFVAFGLSVIVIMTIIGNGFVIAAVKIDQRLHSLANKLVASLAVADIFVGLLVMPLAAVYLMLDRWPFGTNICIAFITVDVLFCTSSILHLVAIAVDRYKMVTDISYSNSSSRKHRCLVPGMIVGAWLLSATICLPPLFGWKTEQVEGSCIISQNKGYTIYSTVGAFYLPCVIILGIYTKIFLVIRYRVRRKKFKTHIKQNGNRETIPQVLVENEIPQSDTTETLLNNNSSINLDTLNGSSSNSWDEPSSSVNLEETNVNISSSPNKCLVVQPQANPSRRSSFQQLFNNVSLLTKKHTESKKTQQEIIAQKRERKAFRTLLIITGVFITCWLPFFIFAVIQPFCTDCSIPMPAVHFVTWLGYFNCAMNPIIYTIFSPDFRMAFKQILSRCSCKKDFYS